MRYLTILFSVLIIAFASGFAKIKSLKVSSTAFTDNGAIPVKYTCTGQQVSPPLTFADVPPETKSLAIIVCDPDAPTKITVPVTTSKVIQKKGKKKKVVNIKESRTYDACTVNGYTHWVLWNLDVSNSIPEDYRPENTGINSRGTAGYVGMCPPTGTHHYHFIVYALDTKLNIAKNTDKATLEKVMEGHILAKGELIGTYNKDYK